MKIYNKVLQLGHLRGLLNLGNQVYPQILHLLLILNLAPLCLISPARSFLFIFFIYKINKKDYLNLMELKGGKIKRWK